MQGAINYNELNDCSNALKKIAEEMKDITVNITKTINGVSSNSYWTGAAAESYFKKAEELKPVFDDAYTQVLEYANAIENAIKRYQSIDNQIFNVMRF